MQNFVFFCSVYINPAYKLYTSYLNKKYLKMNT